MSEDTCKSYKYTREVGHISIITFSPLRPWPAFFLGSIYFETLRRNSTCERCESRVISETLGGEISGTDKPPRPERVGGHRVCGIAK